MVVLAEHGRVSKGQRRGRVPVEHGVNHLRRRIVGDGHHVVADLRHAHGAALGGNAVDGVAGVGVAGYGVRVQPGVELLAGNLAHQHHRISHRPVGSVGVSCTRSGGLGFRGRKARTGLRLK